MICAKQVFRCFKWVERAGDAITGAAGPVFIFLAVCLISTGVVCFFDVVQPTLTWPWLTTPLCLLVVVNLFAHYYLVCTVSPGFVDDSTSPRGSARGWIWAKKRDGSRRRVTGVQWSEELNMTKATTSKCKRCGVMRPERAHHCRICKRCVLKYDHHCPVCRPLQPAATYTLTRPSVRCLALLCGICMYSSGIWFVGVNQCIGLHNERHFVLFLVNLSIASFVYSWCGWNHVLSALGWYADDWNHHVPEIAFLLIYILSVVLFLAVTIMASYHIYGVACGETTVESQDHEYYRRMARGRGEDFVNSYDLGKLTNLKLFFNIGPNGYPTYTLLLPLRTEPYTDGYSWARKQGLQSHPGVRAGDELTDEEDLS